MQDPMKSMRLVLRKSGLRSIWISTSRIVVEKPNAILVNEFMPIFLDLVRELGCSDVRGNEKKGVFKDGLGNSYRAGLDLRSGNIIVSVEG